MDAISLSLSNELVNDSKHFAKQMGVSLTELISQALRHELERLKKHNERELIAASLIAMRNNTAYLNDSHRLDEVLSETLPDDNNNWWTS